MTDEMQIDEKVVRLVEVLSSLAGVFTFSSCGGHEKQTNVSQCAANEWYVNFSLTPHQMAWNSLELIAETAGDFESVNLMLWHDGGVNFELRGTDIEADEVAEAIEKMVGNGS